MIVDSRHVWIKLEEVKALLEKTECTVESRDEKGDALILCLHIVARDAVAARELVNR